MARSGAGRSRRRWRLIGVTALVVGVVAVASGTVVAQRAAAADPVLTATAAREDVLRSVSGTGALVDELTYAVDASGAATVSARAGTSAGGTAAAPASGTGATTVSVAVRPGQRVERGQRLARVEDADGRERDVDAPVAGRIRSVSAAAHATAGELVTIGAGRVLAALTISENRIAQVRTGQAVAVTLAAGTARTTGVVDEIEQVPDDGSGTLRYTVLVRLDRIPVAARIGMSATGEITTARADGVIAVPAAAIEGHGDALRVRVQDGGRITTVPIRIGLVGDAAVEVTSGLRAGQRVVTGAAGEVAATTRRLGPPTSVTGATPSTAPSGGAR